MLLIFLLLLFFISVIQFIDIKLDIHMLIILCYWEVIPSNYKLDLRCKAGFFPKNKRGKIQSRQIENLLQICNVNISMKSHYVYSSYYYANKFFV